MSQSLSKIARAVAVSIFLLSSSYASAAEEPIRLVFTGDILLSREVQREITLKNGQSPWASMRDFFKGADWVMGNLEGSVGDSTQCPKKDLALCFAISPKMLALPKNAGFTAMGIENNHSSDLGDSGRKTTREELSQIGLSAIEYEQSPGFYKKGNRTFSFIALSNVPGRDQQRIEIPSNGLRQKIRLAKSLSDWVIVNVHWGTELTDWPQPKQKEMAKWLIDQGADVIIGHHPHVVQDPECIAGKPVFFSLGNHVFDQKYPATKRGLIADCTALGEQLSCSSVATTTLSNSSFPEIAKPNSKKETEIANCRVLRSSPVSIDGFEIRPRLSEHQYIDGEIVLEGKKTGSKNWNVVAKRILAFGKGRLAKDGAKELLFTLETHPSSIDKEIGPRPYVYDVSPHGLIAKWRGSALAWPLLDGKLIHPSSESDIDYLCALHRKDSFIALNPKTQDTRTAVYKWNGFGFSGVNDSKLNAQCENAFN